MKLSRSIRFIRTKKLMQSKCSIILASLVTVLSASSFAAPASVPSVPDLSILSDLENVASGAPTSALDFQTGMASVGDISGNQADFNNQKKPWSAVQEFSHFSTDLSGDVMNCIEYKVVGMCFSYRITLFGIIFYENFVVEHYTRDTHVEITKRLPMADGITDAIKADENASTDVTVGAMVNNATTSLWKRLNYDGSGLSSNGVVDALKMGSSELTDEYSEGHNYTYSDAMVMGNPELTMFNSTVGSVFGTVGWCDSKNTPYFMYFHSAMDQFSWRWLATTESVLLGLYSGQDFAWNGIGSSFGSTMPRSGYVVSPSRFKSSVVTALRATSIVAENRPQYSGIAGAHLYFPMNEFASNSWTKPQYKTPQNTGFFKMEMVYPFKGKKCTRYKNLSFDDELNLDKQFNKGNKAQSAAFKIYRPIRCCKRKAKYITTVIAGSTIGTEKQFGSPNK